MVLAYAEETTAFGQPENTTLQELRFTGEGLKQNATLTPSTEIRSDRQIADVIRTEASGGGDVNFELSYGSYDDLFEAALMSGAWAGTATVGPAVTISFESIASSATDFAKILDSGSGFGSITAGSWIRVSGSTGNDGFYRVEASIAGELQIRGQDLTDATAGDNITIVQGDQIVNGVVFRSFSFEKEFTDLTNIFARYLGYAIDTFSLTFSADAIITGTFGFLGKKEESAAGSFGSGNTAPTTTDVLAAVDDVHLLLYGDPTLVNPSTLLELDATAFSISVTNNLRARIKIGELGPISLGMGAVNVTGSTSVYFETHTMMDAWLNDSEINMVAIVQASDGSGYVIELPAARFTDGGRVAGGQNTDIMAEMEFNAFREENDDATIRIVRFAA
jgi:hypothetical protein